jgi:plasmid stability protein
MAQMLIRKLDDKVVETLETLAARQGVSRERLVRDLLSDHARKHSREAIIKELDEWRAKTIKGMPVDAGTAEKLFLLSREELHNYRMLPDQPE